MKTLFLTPSTPRLFVVRLTLGVALLQALWIAVVPPFAGSDEFDHAYRATAVADGHWHATEHATDGRGFLVRATDDIVVAAYAQCVALAYTGPDNCVPAGELRRDHVWVGSGAAHYHPAFYWLVGTAAQPFHGHAALYAMRVAAALLCLVFLSLAGWALGRRGTPGWSAIGLTLALSPVLVYSTAIAAPNGLEMAAAVALWSSLLSLRDVADPTVSRRLIALATVSAVVVSTVRMLGPMFVLLILLTAFAYHGSRRVSALVRSHPRSLGAATAVVGLATAGSAWWTVWSGLLEGDGPQGSREWVWSSLLVWPLQAIAAFPYRNQPGAIVVYPIVALTVAALLVHAWQLAARRDRLVLAAVLVVTLAVPVVLTLLTRGDVGVMWQGRYGLPLGVGFVILSGTIIQGRASADPPVGLLVPVAVAMAAAWAACYAKVLADQMTNEPSITGAGWHEPPMWAVVAVCVLAWLLLASAPSRRQSADVGQRRGSHREGDLS